MKIKAEQLDELTRSRIARALIYWANRNEEFYPVISSKYRDIARSIQHGELLLCKYEYDKQEGGEK